MKRERTFSYSPLILHPILSSGAILKYLNKLIINISDKEKKVIGPGTEENG